MGPKKNIFRFDSINMYCLPQDYKLLVSDLNNLFSYNSENKTFKSEKAGSLMCVGDGQEERWIFLIYQEDLKGDLWESQETSQS